MKFKRLNVLITMLFVAAAAASAQQRETFDIATFQPPAGWKKQTRPGVLLFSTTNDQTGSYAMITLYASGTSTGNARSDFDADWREFIAGQLGIKGSPQMEPIGKKDGWDVISGGASFENESGTAAVILNTFSGFGKTFSGAAVFNSQEHLAGIDAFATSLTLKKPQTNQVNRIPPTGNTVGNNGAQITDSRSTSNGFAFATTNFDDGWNAFDKPDWVQVTKGNTTVLLHYGIQYTDATRNFESENKKIEHYWNLLISPRFKVNNINVAKTDYATYDRVYFGEADGIEIETGNRAHIALMITSENGFANCVEIITPDQATLGQQFPNYDKIKEMNKYNKFAVGAKDLPGTWENSSAVYSQYYSTTTGNYAGMGGVSQYDKFIFRPNNTFHYEYIGVSGMMGTPGVHTEKRDGKFTVSNWEMILTDNKGAPVSYFAQFTAIRGGRVLHLQNKRSSGLKYQLYKHK